MAPDVKQDMSEWHTTLTRATGHLHKRLTQSKSLNDSRSQALGNSNANITASCGAKQLTLNHKPTRQW